MIETGVSTRIRVAFDRSADHDHVRPRSIAWPHHIRLHLALDQEEAGVEIPVGNIAGVTCLSSKSII